jgi:hypothetical protein
VTSGSAWAKGAAKQPAANRGTQPPAAQQDRAPAPAKATPPVRIATKPAAAPPSAKVAPEGAGDDTFWEYGGSGGGGGGSGSATKATSGYSLTRWCESELNRLDSSLDAETFAQFILAQNDDEVSEYVSSRALNSIALYVVPMRVR